MRLTSKGQVTIPIGIRERLGLMPGMEVDFEVEGDAIRIRPATGGRSRGKLVVEHLRRHSGSGTMTTDEIMALTRADD